MDPSQAASSGAQLQYENYIAGDASHRGVGVSLGIGRRMAQNPTLGFEQFNALSNAQFEGGSMGGNAKEH